MPTPDASPVVLAAITAAGHEVRSARRKLRSWNRRWESARSERKQRLRVMDSYAQSMRSYLVRYDDLRSDMEAWIAKVDSDGASYSDAYEFLADASSGRASVSKGVGALDAPPSLAAQHAQLRVVIDRAAKAVDDAYTGISDYQYSDGGEYDSYKDTPGWQSFSSESETVSGAYNAARTAWEKRVERRRKAIRNTKLPAAPNV